jgi:hypothetical protein
MVNFTTIESEFLSIEEDNKFIEFHKKYIDIFDNIDFNDKETALKIIWMLSELSGVYDNTGDIVKGKELTEISFKLFNQFSEKFDYNLHEDNQYKLFLIELAGRHFKNRKFSKAKRIYKKIQDWEKYENQVNESIGYCEFHQRKKNGKLIGLIGFIILVSNLVIKSNIGKGKETLILGIIGTTMIVTFGLIEFIYKKPNNLNIGQSENK